MNTNPSCPGCGKPLDSNALRGLCPECLMRGAFPTGPEPVGRTPFVPPSAEELAVKFPQLEILGFIGQGGMGAVYKVRQKQLDRIVALKILPPQAAAGSGFAERFTREARALAKLNHPHIVTLYEFGQADGLFYFLMEFVDGVTLRQLLSTGRIAPNEALAIVPQICEALQFAHDEGIVHRDIKPENILLDKKGRVKIADFGIAKIVAEGFRETSADPAASGQTSELTEAGSVLGTPQYMAPEQVAHPLDVDHRADIYSLGVVFYQMLTGELPDKRLDAPSKKVQIDVRLDEVVLRALEKKPELRFQQAGDVKTLVETIAQTPASAGRLSGPAPRLSRPAVVGACCFPFSLLPLLLAFSSPWKMVLFLPSVLAATIIPTALGWIAVLRIRRSDGRIHGLWLAVLDGLLFPLLLLDTAIWFVCALVAQAIPHAIEHRAAFYTGVLLASILVSITVDILLFRRVWRHVNQTCRQPFPKSVIAVGGLAAVTLLAVVCFMAAIPSSGRLDEGIAKSPQTLRNASAERVIQAALSHPTEPWPWEELQSRAKRGDISFQQSATILDGVTAWLRRDYPNGYDQPLFWLRDLLKELDRQHLVKETNAFAFLDALHGTPVCEPLPRLREGQETLNLTCKVNYRWDTYFAYQLLNDIQDVRVDGQSVPVRNIAGHAGTRPEYYGELQLPALAPGKHIVECQFQSALVPIADIAGLDSNVPAIDWPPAKRKWTRIARTELNVYPKDTELVALSNDPALDPVAAGAAVPKQIFIRRQNQKTTATVILALEPKPKAPVSVEVILELPNGRFSCGSVKAITDGRHTSESANQLTTQIDALDPDIKQASVILVPNPKKVESEPSITRIWGQSIVTHNVPLIRQDLLATDSANGDSTRPADSEIPAAIYRCFPAVTNEIINSFLSRFDATRQDFVDAVNGKYGSRTIDTPTAAGADFELLVTNFNKNELFPIPTRLARVWATDDTQAALVIRSTYLARMGEAVRRPIVPDELPPGVPAGDTLLIVWLKDQSEPLTLAAAKSRGKVGGTTSVRKLSSARGIFRKSFPEDEQPTARALQTLIKPDCFLDEALTRQNLGEAPAASGGRTEPAADRIVPGRVVDQNGKPLSNVRWRISAIEERRNDHWNLLHNSDISPWNFTDSDGRFQLTFHGRQRFDLQLDGGQFAPAFLYEVSSYTSNLMVMMKPGIPVLGTVSDVDGTQEAVRVELRLPGRDLWYQTETITDDHGRFTFYVSAPPIEPGQGMPSKWQVVCAGKAFPIDVSTEKSITMGLQLGVKLTTTSQPSPPAPPPDMSRSRRASDGNAGLPPIPSRSSVGP